MTFAAYLVTRDGDTIGRSVSELDDDDLAPGEVLIDVEWSAVNYKDAMVTVPGNRVARTSPLVPGVDLAGTVAASDDPELPVGTAVLVHGYDLGVARHGGFAERARVPAAWVVPLPADLDARRAMVVGTAGFTAVLSLRRLETLGLDPGAGPVLVTGATGGVGSMAVALLAQHGYEVVASSGKTHEHDYLRRLGAAEIVGRDALGGHDGRVLGPERWAAAVDCVGGPTLAAVLRSRALRRGGGGQRAHRRDRRSRRPSTRSSSAPCHWSASTRSTPRSTSAGPCGPTMGRRVRRPGARRDGGGRESASTGSTRCSTTSWRPGSGAGSWCAAPDLGAGGGGARGRSARVDGRDVDGAAAAGTGLEGDDGAGGVVGRRHLGLGRRRT